MKRFLLPTLLGLLSLSHVAWGDAVGSKAEAPAAKTLVKPKAEPCAGESKALKPIITNTGERVEITIVPRGLGSDVSNLSGDKHKNLRGQHLFCASVKVDGILLGDCSKNSGITKIFKSDAKTACEVFDLIELSDDDTDERGIAAQIRDQALEEVKPLKEKLAKEEEARKKREEVCDFGKDNLAALMCLSEKKEAGENKFNSKYNAALAKLVKGKNLEELKDLVSEHSGTQLGRDIAVIAAKQMDNQVATTFYNESQKAVEQNIRILQTVRNNPQMHRLYLERISMNLSKQAELRAADLQTELNDLASSAGMDPDALGADTKTQLASVTTALGQSMATGQVIPLQVALNKANLSQTGVGVNASFIDQSQLFNVNTENELYRIRMGLAGNTLRVPNASGFNNFYCNVAQYGTALERMQNSQNCGFGNHGMSTNGILNSSGGGGDMFDNYMFTDGRFDLNNNGNLSQNTNNPLMRNAFPTASGSAPLGRSGRGAPTFGGYVN